jgi:hypothetical protein
MEIFVLNILCPIVIKTPTYIKNSMDIIKHLKTVKAKDSHVLITADISSLYTNIEQEYGATTSTKTTVMN